MRRALLLGSLGLLAALGINPVASQPADPSAVKAANAAFYSALAARDISAMERIWARDDQISNVFSRTKTLSFGQSAIKADYERLFKLLGDVPSAVMAEPSVRLQGDMAIVIGVEIIQVKLPNGELQKSFPVATNVFVKQGTEWMMVHHHTSRPE